MNKVAILILTASVLALVGITRLRSSENFSHAQASAEIGTLAWYAESAKSNGKDRITFDAGFESYAEARSLSEAIPYYSIVRVKLIDSHPSVLDSKQIETWWRFKLIEILSQQRIVNCNTCPPVRLPPSTISTALPGQLVVLKKGGTAIIEGVTVTSSDHQIPDFISNREYLLFVNLDPSRTVGNLLMGPAGVYNVRPDGTIQPTIDQPYKIWHELLYSYGASLDRLRARLKD